MGEGGIEGTSWSHRGLMRWKRGDRLLHGSPPVMRAAMWGLMPRGGAWEDEKTSAHLRFGDMHVARDPGLINAGGEEIPQMQQNEWQGSQNLVTGSEGE